MKAPTPGQRAIAQAVASRVEAGDSYSRIIADLLTVLVATISDLPDQADRMKSLTTAATLPNVVMHQVNNRRAVA